MKFRQILAQPIGMILMAIAIVMEKYLPTNPCFDFTVGLLIGMSVILNIYYIILVIKKNERK